MNFALVIFVLEEWVVWWSGMGAEGAAGCEPGQGEVAGQGVWGRKE